MIKEQIKYFAKLKPWPNVRNIVAEIFVIFSVCSNVPCLPHLETLAFIVETKLLPGEQKYFLPNSEKFDEINIYI
jgi:hypothetical protein